MPKVFSIEEMKLINSIRDVESLASTNQTWADSIQRDITVCQKKIEGYQVSLNGYLNTIKELEKTLLLHKEELRILIQPPTNATHKFEYGTESVIISDGLDALETRSDMERSNAKTKSKRSSG